MQLQIDDDDDDDDDDDAVNSPKSTNEYIQTTKLKIQIQMHAFLDWFNIRHNT